jgi:hypothetical protein
MAIRLCAWSLGCLLVFGSAINAAERDSNGRNQQNSAIDVEKTTLIETMIEQTRLPDLMKQMIGQYVAMFNQNFEKSFSEELKKSGDTTDYSDEVKAFEAKMADLLTKRLAWDQVKPKMIALYDESFSKQELSDIVAFYKTATGQSLLRKLPELSQRGMAIGQEQMRTASPEIQQMTMEFMSSISKKRQAGSTRPN